MFHYQMCVFWFLSVYEITTSLMWMVKIKKHSVQFTCLSSTLLRNNDWVLYFSLSLHFHFWSSWLLKGWIAKLKSKQKKKYRCSSARYMNDKSLEKEPDHSLHFRQEACSDPASLTYFTDPWEWCPQALSKHVMAQHQDWTLLPVPKTRKIDLT